LKLIARWLGLNRRVPRVGLHPRRDVELEESYDEAYARVLTAVETVLGANVALADRTGGRIEARFGLVNNERVACTLERIGETKTRVRVEAYFPAGADVPERSRAVDALAAALASPP